MKPFTLAAPSKINLTLEILRRRGDGYHDLRSLMVPVGLFDRVSFAPAKRLELACSHPGLQCGPSNLVMKAALALRPFQKKPTGARLFLRKNAPLAAGLGSGSSDAAVTLEGLNRLWNLGLGKKVLSRLALKLGSDVPLFLMKRPCLAKGRGEKLKPLTGLPAFWVVLCNPGFGVSTAWAYKNFKLPKGKRPDSSARVLACWKKKDWAGLQRQGLNDLEAVVEARYPAIKALKKKLLQAGALAARMSGSGPTVFGVFKDRKSALAAEKKLKGKVKFCKAVPTLATGHPILP